MLKYRIKEDAKSVNYKKIDFELDELKLTLDSESICGVFNRNYQIKNGDEVGVVTVDNLDYTDLIVSTTNVSRSGKFDGKKVLNIQEIVEYQLAEEVDDEYALSHGAYYMPNKCYKYTKRYVILPNGDIAYEHYKQATKNEYIDYKLVETYSKQSTTQISQGINGYFDLKGYGLYENSNQLTQIEIPVTCYVDNGVVVYNDIDYNFEENYEYEVQGTDLVKVLNIYDEDENFLVKLENYVEYDQPQLMTKFSLDRPKDIIFLHEDIITAKKYLYVIYKDKKYTLKFKNGKWVANIKEGERTTSFYYEQTHFTHNIYEEFINYTQYLVVTAQTCNGDTVNYKLPIFYEYRPALGGDYLFIYTKENYNISSGGKINVKIKTNDSQDFVVNTDIKGKFYIMYFGKRLYLTDLGKVKETYKYKIAEYIENDISTETQDQIVNEFDITIKDDAIIELIDNTSSKACIGYYTDSSGNESTWQLERNGKRIRAYKRGAIIEYGNGANSKMVQFHDGKTDKVVKKLYKLNVYRYINIDGIDYLTNLPKSIYEDELNAETYAVSVYLRTNIYELDVIESYSNWFICRPHLNDSQFIKDFEPQVNEDASMLLGLTEIYSSVNDDIINSIDNITFSFVNFTFGERIHPTVFNASLQNILNVGAFELYKKINCISIPVNFQTKTEINLHQEDIVNSDFYLTEKEKAINPIIDMEKDIYYPVIESGNDLKDVLEIKFNIHLRTRDLETWKVNDKTFSACTNNEKSNLTTDNWNVLDNYHQITGNTENDVVIKNTITQDEVFSSDLLYFLNFTEDDVFYQKSKIGKSFLRLSFYDSTDPNTQNLLHYSTIFMNENLLYKKYINNIDNEIYTIYNKIKKENRTYCNVNTEPIITKGGEASIDYTKDRLDASFSVVNRYETDTSSEGFYLYMFKEYGTKLRPSPVFMKVEFNHAGEGKTIPLVMPTIYDGELTCMAENINSHELTNEFTNETLLNEFKQGLSLSKVLINQYIRLEVKYDESKHRYVYYIPQEYYKSNYWKENKLVFNLWELKIKDES